MRELCFTSVPRHLRGGNGYGIAAHTRDMPTELVAVLEQLSKYDWTSRKALDYRSNPVGFSHIVAGPATQRVHVVSRIAACAPDFSGRTNYIAHHVAFDGREAAALPAGPADVAATPGLLWDSWAGEARLLDPRPLPPSRAGAAAIGSVDPGWATVIAGRARQRGRTTYLLPPPGADLLSILRRVFEILPPETRWSTTFTTYAHAAFPGPGFTCQLQGVVAGTAFESEVRSRFRADCLDLAGPAPAVAAVKRPGPAPKRRTDVRPARVTPAAEPEPEATTEDWLARPSGSGSTPGRRLERDPVDWTPEADVESDTEAAVPVWLLAMIAGLAIVVAISVVGIVLIQMRGGDEIAERTPRRPRVEDLDDDPAPQDGTAAPAPAPPTPTSPQPEPPTPTPPTPAPPTPTPPQPEPPTPAPPTPTPPQPEPPTPAPPTPEQPAPAPPAPEQPPPEASPRASTTPPSSQELDPKTNRPIFDELLYDQTGETRKKTIAGVRDPKAISLKDDAAGLVQLKELEFISTGPKTIGRLRPKGSAVELLISANNPCAELLRYVSLNDSEQHEIVLGARPLQALLSVTPLDKAGNYTILEAEDEIERFDRAWIAVDECVEKPELRITIHGGDASAHFNHPRAGAGVPLLVLECPKDRIGFAFNLKKEGAERVVFMLNQQRLKAFEPTTSALRSQQKKPREDEGFFVFTKPTELQSAIETLNQKVRSLDKEIDALQANSKNASASDKQTLSAKQSDRREIDCDLKTLEQLKDGSKGPDKLFSKRPVLVEICPKAGKPGIIVIDSLPK